MRRATVSYWYPIRQCNDFNPRSPWGERPDSNSLIVRNISISIHALREESDVLPVLMITQQSQFQSTLSVRRATINFRNKSKIVNKFQSTLSVRRATVSVGIKFVRKFIFQSTLSVRRATPSVPSLPTVIAISIHALREESDAYFKAYAKSNSKFQSTLSVRRATS